MRIYPHKLIYLNALSLAGGTVGKDLAGLDLSIKLRLSSNWQCLWMWASIPGFYWNFWYAMYFCHILTTPAPARSPLSPYQSQASACPGVWLAYLVTLHWRIIDFPFERRHQLETGTWLGVLFCVRAPIFGMGLLFALNLCRSWASWFYFLDKWTSNLSHLHIRVLSARIQNR